MQTLNTKAYPSRDFVKEADQLYQSGRCDAAVDLLFAGIKQYPDEKSLYYALSEILIDSDQHADALDILNKLPADEEDHKKLQLSGYCQMGLGHLAEADAIAERVLSKIEDAAPALNLKGVVALKNGHKRAATKLFRKAIAVDSEYGEPYTHLGTLSAADSKTSEALDFYEKGFVRAPVKSHIVLSYHSAVQAQSAYQRAEPIFRKASENFPSNKRLSYLLIEVLLQQSKFDMAIKAIEKAIVTFGIEDGILEAALNVRDQLGPQEIAANTDKKNSVSFCMIAKNEEKYLAKCLWSIEPIADEIIVADTGSSDRTQDIAKVFGAKVFDFKWAEDFSKARNFSIAKASGDWIFILDADEVISADDHDRFKALVGSESVDSVAYAIETRNYTMQANTIGWVANDGQYGEAQAGAGWIPSEKVRLFKNDPRIKFEYPVHEIVDPGLKRLGIPIQPFPIPVHHYGKLNPAASRRKTENYYAIGRKKLDEMGDNIVALRELAIQAGHLAKHDEAIALWQRLLKHKPDDPEAYVNMGTAYFNLGKYGQAANSAQKAVALAPEMKEAHFNYAISQLHLGNAHMAIGVLENILQLHPRYQAAQFMLAAAYCCGAQKEKAVAGFKKMGHTAVGPVLAVTFYDLAKRLSEANQAAYAISLLETATESGVSNDNCERYLDNLRHAG
jgi:tetratricopeptide (TPR) repeat protein